MPFKDPEKKRAAARAWAQRNRAKQSANQRDRRNKIRRFIHEYKEKNSVCVDCNISYPPHILDFDHLGDKKFGLAEAAKGTGNLNDVIAEIEKCEIVCANCHRHRTWMRRMAP